MTRSGWLARSWRLVAEHSSRQLTVGVGLVASRLAGFLTGAVVARSIGSVAFAAYTVGFTIFGVLMQATSFADTWLLRQWEHPEQREGIKRAVWHIKASFAVISLGACLVLSVAEPNGILGSHVSWGIIALGVASAGASAYTASVGTVYQAEGRFVAYSGIVSLGPVLALALSQLAAWAGWQAAWEYLLITLTAYLPGVVVAYAKLGRGRKKPVLPLVRGAIRFGGWVTLGSVAYILYQRLDVFLLSTRVSPADLGIYGVAVRLSMAGAIFGNTLVAVLVARGSRRVTWSVPHERRQYLRETAVGSAATVGALLLVGLAAPQLTRIFFGEEYHSAAIPFRILLIGQALLAFQMPFYFAMYALDAGRWIAALGAVQLLVAAVLGIWLIGRFGAEGAAWSNSATYLVGLVGVTLFHRSATGRLTSAS